MRLPSSFSGTYSRRFSSLLWSRHLRQKKKKKNMGRKRNAAKSKERASVVCFSFCNFSVSVICFIFPFCFQHCCYLFMIMAVSFLAGFDLFLCLICLSLLHVYFFITFFSIITSECVDNWYFSVKFWFFFFSSNVLTDFRL